MTSHLNQQAKKYAQDVLKKHERDVLNTSFRAETERMEQAFIAGANAKCGQTALHHLNAAQALIEPIDDQFDNLGKCFDVACSPLSDAVYSLAEAYLQLIADSVKCDRSMLSDWWLGHSFGREPMMVSVDDGPLKPISSNAELADFIDALNTD